MQGMECIDVQPLPPQIQLSKTFPTNTKRHKYKISQKQTMSNQFHQKSIYSDYSTSQEKPNCGLKTLFRVSANFGNFRHQISRCRHKQGSTNSGILPSRIGEHGVKFGEHEYDEKHQPDELKHSNYDSKHTIYDSKHSICQPTKLKTHVFTALL